MEPLFYNQSAWNCRMTWVQFHLPDFSRVRSDCLWVGAHVPLFLECWMNAELVLTERCAHLL